MKQADSRIQMENAGATHSAGFVCLLGVTVRGRHSLRGRSVHQKPRGAPTEGRLTINHESVCWGRKLEFYYTINRHERYGTTCITGGGGRTI